MSLARKPASWKSSDDAIRAVQVAFDVESAVIEAVRHAAFQNEVSPSDQIRLLLQLPTAERAKRPRLTVTLSGDDYALLAQRYGLDAQDRLSIKERVTAELVAFAEVKSQAGDQAPTSRRPRG